MFSNESLEKLREVLRRDGYFVTDKELLNAAFSLFNLIDTVYRPIKKEWLKEFER